MKFSAIILTVFLKCLEVENRMLPIHYVKATSTEEPKFDPPNQPDESPNEKAINAHRTAKDEPETRVDENNHETVIGLKTNDGKENEEYNYEYKNKPVVEEKPAEVKPCAIVVLSNIQNPNMQSLLRKYRYDANGVLIPSSVKYFIKLPQGIGTNPLLVPLNDKAFSHLGGFVRYYKEVPPIPQAW